MAGIVYMEFEERLTGWRSIEPPSNLERLHTELVDALGALQEEVGEYLAKSATETGDLDFDTIGPAVVEVHGDEADATGYSRIYHREGEDFRLFRLGMNHWKLVRRDGRWLIHSRVSQAIGESDVQELMRKGLQ